MVSFRKIHSSLNPFLDFPYGDLADGRRCCVFEVIRPRRFSEFRDLLACQIREERLQAGAFNYDIMTGKGYPNLVVVALGVKELDPREHISALQQNDFERAGSFLSRFPRFCVIG
jgi:hypothetical protein